MRPPARPRLKDPRKPPKARGRKPAPKSGDKSPARGYDNSARVQKSVANQQLILQTLVKLLVEKKGAEVTFEEIAESTGISERTIYRFYKNKEELHRELNVYLTGYLREGVENIGAMKIPAFAKYSFELFDRYEDLFTAYVTSTFGQEARRVFRQKLNLAIIEKILAERGITLDVETHRRLAVIVSLISAKVWHDVRVDFGFNGKEMAGPIEWAVQTLLDSLGKK